MESFKEYLISEYKDKAKGFVATEFKFLHSTNLKLDRKSSRYIKIDTIKVTVKFFDKNLKLLHTGTIQFENNIIPKSKAESLVNISPKELEVKFGFAKKEICQEIFKEYREKSSEINLKIDNLKNYIGCEGIIPKEFKGEVINVTEEEKQDKPPKQEFDM